MPVHKAATGGRAQKTNYNLGRPDAQISSLISIKGASAVPIHFTCPHCGVETDVADEFIGRSGPCSRCGQTITIGGQEPATAGTAAVQSVRDGRIVPGSAATACPECGGYSQRAGFWPWYLGTVGAVLVRAVICNLCGHEFDARKPAADLGRRKLYLALLLNGIGAVGILLIIAMLAALIMSLQ